MVRRSADKRKDAGSTPRFGSTFSSKNVIYGHLSRVLQPCLPFVGTASVNPTLNLINNSDPVDFRQQAGFSNRHSVNLAFTWT